MTRTSEKRTAARYEVERRLAPHVDEKWAEAFVIELRLLDVAGDALGAALAEVESHCAESGEPAVAAFGDPVTYARSLDLPAQREGRWDAVAVLGPVGTQFVGLLVLGWGVASIVLARREGGAAPSVEVTFGMVALLVAFEVAILVFYRHSSAALRRVLGRPVVSFVVLTALMTAFAVGAVLLDGVLVTLPAWPVAVVGALVLVAGTVWSLFQARRGTLEDPILSPVRTAGTIDEGPATRSPGERLLAASVTWIVPLFALASLGATWLLAGR
ncbi:hypothetical protein ACWFNS_06560 [Oerskovia enterophila]